MIAIDLSKQQALDADLRAVQQINFTANLDRASNTRVYFILEEPKEKNLLCTRRCKSIVIMLLNVILIE